MDRRSSVGELSLNASQTSSADSVSLNEVEKQIEHLQSFIKVLKARQQFCETQIRKRESISRSGVQEIEVDITRINVEYNQIIRGLWEEIEGKQLLAEVVNKAMKNSVLKKNFPHLESKKRTMDALLIKFCNIVENEKVLKSRLLKAKREVFTKQISSIHHVDNICKVVEPETGQLQRESEMLKKLHKKVKNVKVAHDMINCFLAEISVEMLFSDPELLKIMKKYSNPLSF